MRNRTGRGNRINTQENENSADKFSKIYNTKYPLFHY